MRDLIQLLKGMGVGVYLQGKWLSFSLSEDKSSGFEEGKQLSNNLLLEIGRRLLYGNPWTGASFQWVLSHQEGRLL